MTPGPLQEEMHSKLSQRRWVAPASHRAGASREEEARIAAVHRYDVLDAPSDGSFDHIASAAANAFGAPIATVTIVDEDRVWLRGRLGVEAEYVGRGPGLCASAILSDEVTVLTDARLDPEALNNPLVRGQLGIRFYAAAPIVTPQGHRLGTVNVMDTTPRSVSKAEAEILRSLAAVVADHLGLRLSARRTVLLERDILQRVREDKRKAEREADFLSSSLRPPRVPEIPGLEVAAYYRPAAGGRLAGDFYHLFPIRDRRWGLIMGDVVGNGVQAGVVAAAARYSLRTALMAGQSPEDALALLNRAMLLDQSGEEIRFCSALAATLEQSANHVDVALADGGHPRPLVRRTDGTTETMNAAGSLVGCFEDAEFTSSHTILRPGDAILFYTDGIVEAKRGRAGEGDADLRRAFAGASHLSAERTVSRLAGDLADSEGEPRDDVALLCLRVAEKTQG